MKKYILLLTFLALLFTPCLAQGQLFGKQTYSGPKFMSRYSSWSFFACCQIRLQTDQCTWATRYLSCLDPSKPFDCCKDTLLPPYNIRCLNAVGQNFGQYFLCEVQHAMPASYWGGVANTKEYFSSNHFIGPYFAYHTDRNQWVILYGVEYNVNFWKDRTITIYYFDPDSNQPLSYSYTDNQYIPFQALYPL